MVQFIQEESRKGKDLESIRKDLLSAGSQLDDVDYAVKTHKEIEKRKNAMSESGRDTPGVAAKVIIGLLVGAIITASVLLIFSIAEEKNLLEYPSPQAQGQNPPISEKELGLVKKLPTVSKLQCDAITIHLDNQKESILKRMCFAVVRDDPEVCKKTVDANEQYDCLGKYFLIKQISESKPATKKESICRQIERPEWRNVCLSFEGGVLKSQG